MLCAPSINTISTDKLLKDMKSKYTKIVKKLQKWMGKYNEFLLKLQNIEDEVEESQLKKEYAGYTSIFDFKEHCALDHAELRKESPEVLEWLGLPDYFWELELEVGQIHAEGTVVGFEWYLDDICYLLEKDGKFKLIPINMKLD